MTSIFPPGFSQFLATLRTLPLWILAGVTLASLGVLYAPEFGGVSLGEFRGAIGPYIWAGCIAFGILAITKAVDLGVSGFFAHRDRRESERAVYFVPVDGQGWWGVTRQPDGSYVAQIRAALVASNLMQGALGIVNARLIRPRAGGEVIQTIALVRSPRGYSSRNVIGGRNMGDVSVMILLRGTWQRAGRMVRATIGITDQYGSEHRVKIGLKPFPEPAQAPAPAAAQQNSA
jgi:hypothetical protein